MHIISKTEYITLDAKLRVGVLSDSQISPFDRKGESTFAKNLLAAFGTLKAQGCNVILFAGDICNVGGKYAYRTFMRCLKKAYDDELPVFLGVMGNHDYYLRTFAKRLFRKETGRSPFAHLVINGFHFIAASPDCSSMSAGYRKTSVWLAKELRSACADTPDRPVFVLTHNAPENTVYGSDVWGDKSLNGVFDEYPNVVNFSGHTHYSLLDERSFYRGKFMGLNTQSVSYTELEKGRMNGSVPPLAYTAPMGYILDFGDDKIDVLRYNMLENSEERANDRWSIPAIITGCVKSAAQSMAAPEMTGGQGVSRSDGENTEIAFAAARGKNFAHTYKLVFDDGTEQLYYGDFYLGEKHASDVQKLTLYGKAAGVYDVKVYAVDSAGRVSENCVEVPDTVVRKRTHYRRKLAPEIVY